MNKFNKAQYNVLKERRAKKSQEKRLRSGMASLKIRRPSTERSASGKKVRKLEKKLRRAQKEAIESGLVTMQDVEMIAAENSANDDSAAAEKKTFPGFKVKKMKLRKKKQNPPPSSSASEPMQE